MINIERGLKNIYNIKIIDGTWFNHICTLLTLYNLVINSLTHEKYFLRKICISSKTIINSSKYVHTEDTHGRLRALDTESKREIKHLLMTRDNQQDSGMQSKTKEHS